MDADSEILIDEMVLPATGVALVAAQLDILMMVALGAAERTLEQWVHLMDVAGMKLKGKYQYTDVLADTVLVVVPK